MNGSIFSWRRSGRGDLARLAERARALAPALALTAACWLASAAPVFAAPPATAQEKARATLGVLGWVGIVLGLHLLVAMLRCATVAAALVAQALFPQAVARARARATARPVQSLLVGFVDLVGGLAVILLLFRYGERFHALSWLGLALLAGLLAVAVCGLAGVYGAVGARLGNRPGECGEILRGGAALETATLIPVLGWLGHLALGSMGVGVGALQWFDRKRSRALDSD